MPKFRKKPVVVEAVQYKSALETTSLTMAGNGPVQEFMRSNGHAGYALIRVSVIGAVEGSDLKQITGYEYAPFIKTLEGDMRIDEGDWIIKGVHGEFYPCKPAIFEATYDPA